MQVTPIEFDYQPNRYSYNVKCRKAPQRAAEDAIQADKVAMVKFSIWHRKTELNKCPVVFDYNLEVRCAQPHFLQLNQLLVNNEESNIDQVALIPKWKCPIKLSSNLVMAHLDRPFLVQMLVKDMHNNIFDNFTSLAVEWEIGNKKLLEISSQPIKSVELSALEDRTGLAILADTATNAAYNEKLHRNRVYYQIFAISSKLVRNGQNGNDSKLTAKLFATKNTFLSKSLSVHFVSEVRVQPDSLTVFNHPSNVVTLALLNGSSHYQAEIETIRVEQQNADAVESQVWVMPNRLILNVANTFALAFVESAYLKMSQKQ